VEVGAKLIVIDCLHAAVQGADLSDNHIARAVVMGLLRVWSFHCHVSVLVLHHLTKSTTRGWQPERFADSAQILAAASCHFYMERREETETQSRVILHGKGRHPAPYGRIEMISEGILDYRLADAKAAYVQPRRQTLETRILALLETGWPLTSAEIARKLNESPGSVRTIIGRLKTAGAITIDTTQPDSHRYKLARPA
jgi:hypothetical protein